MGLHPESIFCFFARVTEEVQEVMHPGLRAEGVHLHPPKPQDEAYNGTLLRVTVHPLPNCRFCCTNCCTVVADKVQQVVNMAVTQEEERI